MDSYDIVFYLGWAYVLLSAVGYALLLRSHQQQAARIRGLQGDWKRGWDACEAKWRNEPLYKRGYEQCLKDRLEAAAEMDAVRQNGLLKS